MNTDTLLKNIGISRLSAMQQNAVEVIRNNINAVLLAPTGSGKTLAFLLPLIEAMDTVTDELQTVIISPTRELALQTFGVLLQLKTSCRAVCCYGGRPAMEEHRRIAAIKPHIIIATPGRLNDHIDKQNINPLTVKTLVVDEFDKMLELNFQDEMEALLLKLTNRRRCILISATDAKEIPGFMAFRHHRPAIINYLDARRVAEEPQITHLLVRSPQKDKLETLSQLLCTLGSNRSLVFVNYREAAERTARYLLDNGHSVSLFHGGMEQPDRETALSLFRNHSVNILVATDLAARGIDIPSLRNVIHYHLPQNQEAYTHRCGRTGRWDSDGNSYIIIGPDEELPPFCSKTEETALTPPFARPAKPEWVTLYIGRGKKDKLGKGDIVGFLCKTGRLNATQIGNIDLRDRYSYVAVRRAEADSLLRNIAGEKIKKMSTKIELIRTGHLVPKQNKKS